MSEEAKNQKPITTEIWEWIRDIASVLIIVYLIITFVAQNTKVVGRSMEPTLHHNDAVIVNKFIYRFTDPKQLDIIVFPYQRDPSKKYIKRIIGLPGDSINVEGGTVLVNGEPLKEDYIKEPMEQRGNIQYPFIVPEDTYFVMGDNRNNSSDSRYEDVGTIERNKIFGKASLRIWPLDKFGFIH